jgi:hypothetical protein
MSLKDYRTSLMPHITRIVADATAGNAQSLGAPPSPPPTPPSPFHTPAPSPRRRSLFLTSRHNQHFLMILFQGYADIADSLSHLKQIDRYLNRAPGRTAPITRSAHLSYHYNAFLNETAIIEDRINHHLSLVTQKYRFEPDSPRIKKALEELQKLATAALKPLSQLRSQHAHEKKYTHPEIERFRIIEMISVSQSSPFSKSTVEQTFKHTRKIVRDAVQEHTVKVEGVVDSVFRVLKQLVIRGNGVRFPVR